MVLIDDLLNLPRFEKTPPDEADMAAAFSAFLAFGKGGGHPASLNFGDVFAYALAKVRDLPLLFKATISRKPICARRLQNSQADARSWVFGYTELAGWWWHEPREYQAAASIQRYIIVEQRGVGAQVLWRDGDRWFASAAIAGDTFAMPEIGIEVPLLEFYVGLDVSEPDTE